MKVILLKDVRNVGRKYEVKNVSEGFAMNSLIPNRLAEIATDSAMKKLDAVKKRDDAHRTAREEHIARDLDAVSKVVVEIASKANDSGHLFAAIHKDDLLEEVRKQSGLELDRDYIVLEKPLKEVGEHSVKVKVADKEAEFKVVISKA